MKKIIQFVLIGLLAFILSGCGGGDKAAAPASPPAKQESVTDLLAKANSLPGLAYDFTMKGKEGTLMSGKVWMSGKKMKTEILIDKMKVSGFMDMEAMVMYNYMPEQNMLMKIPLEQNDIPKTPAQFSKEAAADGIKLKILETVTYDGVRCKVITQTDEKQEEQVKLWVREDYGIPVKVEMTLKDGSLQMLVEYKNIQVGPVPPETFVLPQGVPITDMTEMMKQAAGSKK